MKTFLIIVICFFFSAKSFSQQLTYKELAGTWQTHDTAFGGNMRQMRFHFVDSSHIIVAILSNESPQTNDSLACTYTLSYVDGATLLHATGSEEKSKNLDKSMLLKAIDKDTIKIEAVTVEPAKWSDVSTLPILTITRN